ATPNSDGKIEPISTFAAHGDVVEDVAWSRHHQHLFGSVSDDKHLYLWAHTDEVFSVQWAPFKESVFASSGSDRRLNVWDTSRIGAEQDPEDAEVSDFSWELNQDWVVASVAEDNILQVWQLADAIVHDGEDEDAEEPADDDLE
ncbi:rbbp4, partial [Symbiodinium sp. KB8]